MLKHWATSQMASYSLHSAVVLTRAHRKEIWQSLDINQTLLNLGGEVNEGTPEMTEKKQSGVSHGQYIDYRVTLSYTNNQTVCLITLPVCVCVCVSLGETGSGTPAVRC